ncbi:hypothetical protein [Corallincola spongiicola]|uniref:Uncharacterized protein n=1 Tax=Corallincola spongiicola TaxID=2520508 RepID=A0ABY1WT59_9GAMM|nr:hypothetical protein [Corallincola spongiicola]TAA47915.1 hypothetical protein EXY25_01330 [Corallincola spongiicola]
MSMFYCIETLSDENIGRIIEAPYLYYAFEGDEESYIEKKSEEIINSRNPVYRKLSQSELSKKLGLFQPNKESMAIEDFKTGPNEKQRLESLGDNLEPDESWTPFQACFVSYFMKKCGLGDWVFSMMGDGLYLKEIELEVYTTENIRTGLEKFDESKLAITIEDSDLQILLERRIIRDEEELDYYKNNKEKAALWVETCILNLKKELDNCIDMKVGLTISLC